MDEIEKIKEKIIKPEEKKDNKKSASWTQERRDLQRIKMIRMQAQGKGYKGKNIRAAEKTEKTEEIEEKEEKTEEIEEKEEKTIAHKSVGVYITEIIIGIIFAFFVLIFLIKTGSLPAQKGE